MPIAIQITTIGFDEAAKALEAVPNGFPKAAADAINRGLTAGRQLASSKIYGTYNISQGEAKSHLTMHKASWGSLTGELVAQSSMLPIERFNPTVRMRRIGGRKGRLQQMVSVAVLRGGKKPIGPGPKTMGAFKNIKTGRIMERRQQSKYPIFPVSAIGVAHMLGALKVGDEVQQRMSEMINKRLQANVARLLATGGKWRG